MQQNARHSASQSLLKKNLTLNPLLTMKGGNSNIPKTKPKQETPEGLKFEGPQSIEVFKNMQNQVLQMSVPTSSRMSLLQPMQKENFNPNNQMIRPNETIIEGQRNEEAKPQSLIFSSSTENQIIGNREQNISESGSMSTATAM